MGFRFRRSVRIAPGLRLNFGKRGTSFSVGQRGLTTNFSKSGTRTTFSLPGSGISYTTSSRGKGGGSAVIGLIVLAFIVAAVLSRL